MWSEYVSRSEFLFLFFFFFFQDLSFFPSPHFPESYSKGHHVIRKAGGASTLLSGVGQKLLGLLGTL